MATALAEQRRREAIQRSIANLQDAEPGDVIKYWVRGDTSAPYEYGLVGFKEDPHTLYINVLEQSDLPQFHRLKRDGLDWREIADRLGMGYGVAAREAPDRVIGRGTAQSYEIRFVTSAKAGRKAKAAQQLVEEKKARMMVEGSAAARVRGEIDAATLLKRIEKLPADYTFKVKARTGSGREHDVKIKVDKRGKRILSVDGTPGSWYAYSLLEEGDVPRGLWIDVGQNWTWANPREVFAAFMLDSNGGSRRTTAKAATAPRSSGKSAARKKTKTMSTTAKRELEKLEKALYPPEDPDAPWDYDTLQEVRMILVTSPISGDEKGDVHERHLAAFSDAWYGDYDSEWDAPEAAAEVIHAWNKAKAKAKPKRKATKKKTSKAKPAAASGPTLCCLEWTSTEPSTFLWRSRGGTGAHSKTAARGTSRTGSRFYKIDLAVLIERMGKMGLRAEKIAVDTRALKDLPLSQRVIARDVKLPSTGEAANELRAKLGSKGAKVGRPPGAKGGGNTTRSMRFYLSRPLTSAEAKKLDREPTKAELDTAGKKPKRKATKKKATKKMAKAKDYSDARYVAINPKTQLWGRGDTIYEAKKNAGAGRTKMLVYRMPDGTKNPHVDAMGTLVWEWKSERMRNEPSPVGGQPWIVEEPAKARAKKTAKKKTAKASSPRKRKLTETEADVLESLYMAVLDGGMDGGRQFFVDDDDRDTAGGELRWTAVHNLVNANLARVVQRGDDWVFVQATDAGLRAGETAESIRAVRIVPKATKKKATKKKAAKETETKVEKATYLSFEDASEFNKAVVRLLGEMDAPKTTTIDASSLQIRIPMAKTTDGVQKLVKGLRSGSDRAKFRVHNPHPPREFVVVGKGTGKLGEKIKRYRDKRGISRKDLAKVMLIESSTLGQIERGSIKCPPYARLDRAADKLGVETSTLTAAAVCDYRTKKARKTSKKKKKATRATPVAKDRCARKGSISTKSRDRLPAKAFGLPELRSYPMFKMGGDGKLVPSASHASNAKARARQQLDKGNLSRKDYDRIVRKANKVLAQCSAPVRRAKKKAKKSARAKARRLCPADQRKILNRALREMM